jgi:uncharacterized membrane protein
MKNAMKQHAHAAPAAGEPPARATLVWDLPVRLFHWLLVLLVTCSALTGWFAAEIGSAGMQWHKRSGYCILALVLFRVAWGFFGALASFGWFTAFALRNAADVRTLALVEVLYGYAVSRRIFKEKITRRETIGIGLLIAGIIAISAQL